MAATILILPGYGDSGPGHWQTLWEEEHGWARVVQDDWEQPDLAAWTRRLDEALARAAAPSCSSRTASVRAGGACRRADRGAGAFSSRRPTSTRYAICPRSKRSRHAAPPAAVPGVVVVGSTNDRTPSRARPSFADGGARATSSSTAPAT
jgi:predicted alpha/beta hydrolase family esterase